MVLDLDGEGGGPTVALWSLKLCNEYYRSSLGALFGDTEDGLANGSSESGQDRYAHVTRVAAVFV